MNYLLVDPASESLVDYRPWYVVFNWIESACWLGFAVFVCGRHLRYRRTWIEPMYALTFLIFALTDAIETTGLTIILLVLKAVCILALIAQRKLVVQHYSG
ncbi:MAG TPA: hypothetical protein VHX44_15270 [Planctomycetota bacterium]|nr:hypothetical protein [Planctomycetota bacterium]